MAYLIAILAPLALFVAFVALTVFERRRGARLFEKGRLVVDAFTRALVEDVQADVPFSRLMHGVRVLFVHIAHDIATVALMVVRAIERRLAGKVHQLKNSATAHAETRSGFLKSISYFKRTLRQPEVPQEEQRTAQAVE